MAKCGKFECPLWGSVRHRACPLMKGLSVSHAITLPHSNLARDVSLPHSSEFISLCMITSFHIRANSNHRVRSLPRAFEWIRIFERSIRPKFKWIQISHAINFELVRNSHALTLPYSSEFESPARSIPPAFERVQISRVITFELIRISRAITLPHSSEFDSPARSLFRNQSNLNLSRIRISRVISPSPASTLFLAITSSHIRANSNHPRDHSSAFEWIFARLLPNASSEFKSPARSQAPAFERIRNSRAISPSRILVNWIPTWSQYPVFERI